ncbi:amino acid/polyamine transporter I [Scheffersomyces amazonensis]|uniref:amino acid/polyamine transporter I n=1 Tax=Scheffersomyces amazonensis TaxID=1078765 RepID=UPI00315DE55A
MNTIKSRTEEHIHNVLSNRSELRHIDPLHAQNDVELLAQIGYKQELDRHYSILQVFGIAFSIMGLLPSISSTIATGLEGGPASLVWGWMLSSIFIFCTGTSITILGSSMPTSGGLYYYTNYYAPDIIRVPLSFLIGCSNTLGLMGGICSICYGFSVEVLSAVSISTDETFEITNAKLYGVFAACVVSNVIVCCLTTKHTASLQTVSIVWNSFISLLFLIAVPIGVSRSHSFNNGAYIFGKIENFRTWSPGWSFMLSWMPAIWTIGGYDSVIHCSEEAKQAQKAIPYGILGSIGACWIIGWAICIVCAASIKDGNTLATLETATGSPMAQIIYDSLGKDWAVAFMAMIAVGQYMMACSIMIAASRQIWAFARDDGLPIVYNFIKYVNPIIKVPIRATMFAGCASLILGLLVLVGPAGANALFSLGVASNLLAFGMPVFLVVLPYGRKKFIPGLFYLGDLGSYMVHIVTSCWVGYVIVMSMFPDNKGVDASTMNYTVAVNLSVWILCLIYFFVYGYKFYSGPKSNLDREIPESINGQEPEMTFDQVMDYDKEKV